MNINEANTEAYAIFRTSHKNINLTTKVGLGALLEMKKLVQKDPKGKLLSLMVDELKMPWGTDKPFPGGSKIIDRVANNHIYNSFVQGIGNFEYFITHLVADLCHFTSLRDANQPFNHAHITEYKVNNPPVFAKCCFGFAEQFNTNYGMISRLDKLREDINLINKQLDFLVSLFKYLWLIRNCIVHLEGMANKDICDYYNSGKVNASFQEWDRVFASSKSPVLPIPVRGKKLKLNATHPILCSSICFEIAKIYNSKSIEIMDIKGLIHMATYYGLIQEDHEYRYERVSNSTESVVLNFLTNRYHVMDIKSQDVITIMREIDLWEIGKSTFIKYPNKGKYINP